MPMMQNSSPASSDKKICVARIVGPHGIRGLLKLKFFGDDVSILEQEGLIFNEKGLPVSLTLKNKNKDFWLITMDGINDRTDAEKLGKVDLYINRSSLHDTQEDEYYYEDLIGLDVFNTENEKIGTVLALGNFGASDVIEIKTTTGKTFMLPFKDDYVPTIEADKIIIQDYESLI